MSNMSFVAGRVENVFPRPVNSDSISDVKAAMAEDSSVYVKLNLCNAYSDTKEYMPWTMEDQNENQLGQLNSARSKKFALVITRKRSFTPLFEVYADNIETVVERLKKRNITGTLVVNIFNDKTSHSNKTLRLLLK